MQLSPLAVSDPLTDKTVIINIQVNADNSKPRGQRPVLVTAGISGKAPIMLSGNYGQLNQLIEQAWKEFGKTEKPGGINDQTSTTIAQVSVKQNQKKPNKESILSLF